MKCPLCDVNLVMSERQGIEIDYCPQCRGVWLDRGELDKIIERSGSVSAAPARASESHYEDRGSDQRRYEDRHHDDRRYDDRRYGDRRYDKHDDHFKKGKKKRENFLSELFEFGD